VIKSNGVFGHQETLARAAFGITKQTNRMIENLPGAILFSRLSIKKQWATSVLSGHAIA
jgi:hypothetical protein